MTIRRRDSKLSDCQEKAKQGSQVYSSLHRKAQWRVPNHIK